MENTAFDSHIQVTALEMLYSLGQRFSGSGNADTYEGMTVMEKISQLQYFELALKIYLHNSSAPLENMEIATDDEVEADSDDEYEEEVKQQPVSAFHLSTTMQPAPITVSMSSARKRIVQKSQQAMNSMFNDQLRGAIEAAQKDHALLNTFNVLSFGNGDQAMSDLINGMQMLSPSKLKQPDSAIELAAGSRPI
jgi:hypothetical protein